jgi:hypothetical protein
MLEKIKAFYNLFRLGQTVADKQFWQRRQVDVVPTLSVGLVALYQLGKQFGVHWPLDENSINFLAVALYGVVNTILTIITSEHLGIPVADEQVAAQEDLPSRFDADTMQRAKEWLAQNKKADN